MYVCISMNVSECRADCRTRLCMCMCKSMYVRVWVCVAERREIFDGLVSLSKNQ